MENNSNIKLPKTLGQTIIAERMNGHENLGWVLMVYFEGNINKFSAWYSKQGAEPEKNAYMLKKQVTAPRKKK